jgi:hypothetical protein
MNSKIDTHGPCYKLGPKVFEAQKIRDQWLKNHCQESSILYVEIPYFETDIPKFLAVNFNPNS